ncbi:DegT/DnrJ/EryC1/StrS family aminotransferase [Oscillatoria salina]|uniref:DegT/DnrJ/EryC1/StrS family aminotransferase n=1 Tax=Oscillatoria salina TaxID=331517 RepID=UPI0013B75E74|nr:DegT/DnrJ/EryC1/StrS family aminotransferase [Oscillatoria salina]MBZ8179115.1 DegT/DnrJ/EryC1/StrS family aminotransferase [Oscillatoria salina IIICB1]NET87012.1 DegT/DnrJ/EryC1/StrS family aminotransferase [Kamptonema sp. SIO1D9]
MTPTSVKIPFVDLNYLHQPLQAQLKAAIENVIERGDFILGQAVSEFEQAFARASNVEYGVGVGSGTDAIALGLQACGIGSGDEVILPANTFIATLIGVLSTGATPILVDCDPNTALIDLEAASKAVTNKTKAIVPVHLYGQMVSPHQLLDFASTYNLLIFEDAAQAHLAQREGYTAGSVGIAAAYSFYPSKNLGAFGDAGILLTKDENVAKKVRSLRNYGAPRKYYHTEVGTNSRLDSLQAAVLNVKLPYLSQWNALRNQAAQQYDRQLQKLDSQGITAIANHSSTGHIYHLYVIRVRDRCSLNQEQILAGLATKGVQTGIHYPIPCHLQPAYTYLGYQVGDFPHAEALCQEIVSLPMYPGLSESQIEEVTTSLENLLTTAVIAG